MISEDQNLDSIYGINASISEKFIFGVKEIKGFNCTNCRYEK